jgi:hypothetical protein
MGIVDELQKLRTLHAAGELTDEEYARAKAAVLDAPPAPFAAPADDEVPLLPDSRQEREKAPNFRLFATLGMVAVFLIAMFTVFLPRLERGWDHLNKFRGESHQRHEQLRAKPGLGQ